jgi:hypothetical protein
MRRVIGFPWTKQLRSDSASCSAHTVWRRHPERGRLPAEHLLMEQSGNDLLDVLWLVVMSGVHQNPRISAIHGPHRTQRNHLHSTFLAILGLNVWQVKAEKIGFLTSRPGHWRTEMLDSGAHERTTGVMPRRRSRPIQ